MVTNPFKTLGLPVTATPDEVKAAWRSLASKHHPDRGGSPDIFDTMRQAYTEALKIASKPRKCSSCNGTGKQEIKESWSFHSIKMRCKTCKGKGEL